MNRPFLEALLAFAESCWGFAEFMSIENRSLDYDRIRAQHFLTLIELARRLQNDPCFETLSRRVKRAFSSADETTQQCLKRFGWENLNRDTIKEVEQRHK